MTDLGSAAFSDSATGLIYNSGVAVAVDNAGQVFYQRRTSTWEGSGPIPFFEYSAGITSDLTPIVSSGFFPVAVNDSSQMAGSIMVVKQNLLLAAFESNIALAWSNDGGLVAAPPEIQHAAFYSGGQLIDLGTLGGDTSAANGINNSGQVVGYSLTPWGEPDAFLYSAGIMQDLGTLGGSSSTAYNINDAGQVVGASITNFTQEDAFLYSGGVMTDLNSLLPANSGWQLQGATAINDAGQIIGYGLINGQTDAFLLDTSSEFSNLESVPEPSSLALLVGGSALLALHFRFRRR